MGRDVVLNMLVFSDDGVHIRRKILAEKISRNTVERFKNVSVQRERSLEIEERPGNFRKRNDHLLFSSLENLSLDVRELIAQKIELVLDGTVELAEHVVEDKSRVFLGGIFVKNGMNLKHLGKFVHRVDGVIARGNDEVLTDDKIDFLIFLAGMRVPEDREVQNEIKKFRVAFRLGLLGGKEQFFSDQRVEAELVHERTHLVTRRHLEVNPNNGLVCIPVHHVH